MWGKHLGDWGADERSVRKHPDLHAIIAERLEPHPFVSLESFVTFVKKCFEARVIRVLRPHHARVSSHGQPVALGGICEHLTRDGADVARAREIAHRFSISAVQFAMIRCVLGEDAGAHGRKLIRALPLDAA